MEVSTSPARQFNSGYPELNFAYQRVFEKMRSCSWTRPFSYRFYPDSGGEKDVPLADEPGKHILTVGDTLRYVRHTSSLIIQTQIKSNEKSLLWSDICPLVAPTSFRSSKVKEGELDLLDRISPVFWPLTASNPVQLLICLKDEQRRLWNQEVALLHRSHPELLKRRPRSPLSFYNYPPDSTIISHSDRAFLAMSKQLARVGQKQVNSMFKSATRDWWKYFVDRQLFRGLVSVCGSHKGVRVDMSSYAAFTRLPDPSKCLDDMYSFGELRRILATSPWSMWNETGFVLALKKLGPVNLSSRISKLPVSMLLTLPMVSIHNVYSKEVVDILEKVAHPRHRLLARQLDMASFFLATLYQNAFRPSDELVLFRGSLVKDETTPIAKVYLDSFLSRPDPSMFLVDVVKAWRHAFPKDYAAFTTSLRLQFIEEATLVLMSSPSPRLCLPLVPEFPVGPHIDTKRRSVFKSALDHYEMLKLIPVRPRGRPRKAIVSEGTPRSCVKNHF